MIDTSTISIVKQMVTTYGLLNGLLILIALIVIAGIMIFLNSRLNSIANEMSEKAILKFTNKLELLFRDEQIRINYLTNLASLKLDKNIEMYKKLHKLYFNYQKTWFFKKETDPTLWENAINELWDLRKHVFTESILLGENTINYVDCIVQMVTGIEMKQFEVNDVPQRLQKNEEGNSSYHSQKAYEYLSKCEKWIIDNLLTSIKFDQLEFDEDTRKKINEQKKDVVEKHLK